MFRVLGGPGLGGGGWGRPSPWSQPLCPELPPALHAVSSGTGSGLPPTRAGRGPQCHLMSLVPAGPVRSTSNPRGSVPARPDPSCTLSSPTASPETLSPLRPQRPPARMAAPGPLHWPGSRLVSLKPLLHVAFLPRSPPRVPGSPSPSAPWPFPQHSLTGVVGGEWRPCAPPLPHTDTAPWGTSWASPCCDLWSEFRERGAPSRRPVGIAAQMNAGAPARGSCPWGTLLF